MGRVNLILYTDPGSAEVFLNLRLKNSEYTRLTAVIDTGAEVSLFPRSLLDDVEHRLTERPNILVEQAGIAHQAFEAVEAFIHVFLEDASGGKTKDLEIRAWFTRSNVALVGFADLLDRATLHMEMRQDRNGWIELDD